MKKTIFICLASLIIFLNISYAAGCGEGVCEPDFSLVQSVTDSPVSEDGWVSLLVIDKETSKRIANAKVVYRKNCCDTTEYKLGENGWCRMKLHKANPEFFSLQVIADDYIPMSFSYRKKRDGKLPTKIRLELEKGKTIGGYVKDEANNPIQNAEVYINISSDRNQQKRINIRDHKVITNSKGYWQCDILPKTFSQFRIRLYHDNYVSDKWAPTDRYPNVKKLLNQTASTIMKKGHTVEGIVVDENNTPLKGIKIVEGTRRFCETNIQTVTDKNGHFKLSNLSDQHVNITALSDSYAPELIKLPRTKDSPNLKFILKPSKTLNGKVVDSDNNPIAGVKIEVSGWKGLQILNWKSKTDSNGNFEWKNAPYEICRYSFYHRDYCNQCIDLQSGDQEHIIKFEKVIYVSGKVKNNQSRYLDEYEVYPGIKLAKDYTAWEDHAKTKGNKDGFEIKLTSNLNSRVIKIVADGFDNKIVEINSSDGLKQFKEIELNKAEYITSCVISPDGKPVKKVKLYNNYGKSNMQFYGLFQVHNENDYLWSQTDDNGFFKAKKTNRNDRIIIVNKSGYTTIQLKDIDNGKEIKLNKWGKIKGQVFSKNKPLANCQVDLDQILDGYLDEFNLFYNYNKISDKNGFFDFQFVPAGKWKVGKRFQLSHNSWNNSHGQYVIIENGQCIEVKVGGGGLDVKGKFVFEKTIKKPINLNCLDGSVNSVTAKKGFIKKIFTEKQHSIGYNFLLNEDGEFTIEDIPPGKYQIEFMACSRNADGFPDYANRQGNCNETFEIPESAMEAGVYDTGEFVIKK